MDDRLAYIYYEKVDKWVSLCCIVKMESRSLVSIMDVLNLNAMTSIVYEK
jgi:hypothetical protein